MSPSIPKLAAALLGALLLAAGASFASTRAAVGSDGEVYLLRQGTYGDLFPDASSEPAETPVLALDVVRADHPTERLLVPATEGPETLDSTSIYFDRRAHTLYLVWAGQRSIHSTLNLVSLSSDGWSPVFELSGDPWSIKSNPRLATTRHQVPTLNAEGEVELETRGVLHLLWWDEGGWGSRALYTPLVIEHGAFVGGNRIFDLAAFLPDGLEVSADAPSPGLYGAPTLGPGRNDQRLVASFVDLESNGLATLEIQVLRPDLVALADRARAIVIDIGHTDSGLDRTTLAQRARPQMVEVGNRLMDPELAAYLTDGAMGTVAASDPEEPLTAVAERARAIVIDIGASLSDSRSIGQRARAIVIDIGARISELEGTPEESPAMVKIAPLGLRPAPVTPDRPIRTLASPDGGDLIVAWDTENAIRYRETSGGDWSDAKVLPLKDGLGREEAYRILQQRLER